MASDGNVFYAISPSGLAAMLEFEDQLQQKAREDAKRKSDQQVQERKIDERWRKDFFFVLTFHPGLLIKLSPLYFYLK